MSPLRRVSSRRAREQARRRQLLERDHGPQRCQWPGGCVNAANDPDEIRSRARGGKIDDPDNVWLLCRAHHDWKHAHPEQAKAMGIYPSALPLPAVRRDVYDQAVPRDPANHQPKIAMRVTPEALAWADAYAVRTGRSRSDILRATLSAGTAHPDEIDEKLGYTAPPPLPEGLTDA